MNYKKKYLKKFFLFKKALPLTYRKQRSNRINLIKMKLFKIEFQDVEGNEIYSMVREYDNLEEAIKYSRIKFNTTSDECTQFQIFGL